jgi:hypothetical protein
MFIGHFGVGLAAKRIVGSVSLGTLVLATQFIDLLWPALLLLGIEHVEIDPGNTSFTPLDFTWYPYSHSFFGVLVWSLLFGAVYYLFRKNARGSLVLGGLVMSHWVLDLITHRPDLPLSPWTGLKVGFGLWNSVVFTMLTEGAIFIIGSFLYVRATKAENRKGSIGLWSLLIVLGMIYILNIVGPPPETSAQIGVIGLFLWLFVVWGYFIDRNRVVRVDSRTGR